MSERTLGRLLALRPIKANHYIPEWKWLGYRLVLNGVLTYTEVQQMYLEDLEDFNIMLDTLLQ